MGIRSEEYDKVVDSVDFDWVKYEDVVANIALKVLPGKAVRHYQELYEKSAAKNNSGLAPPKGMLPQSDQIRSGSRAIARQAVISTLNGEMLEMRQIDGVKFVRRNRFTASEVDAIVAKALADAVQTPPTSVLAPIPVRPPYALLFDHRTVKQGILVKNTEQAGQVVLVIKDILDDHDLVCHFTPVAADWVSDQLGLQAIQVRGSENPQKIVLPEGNKWPSR